MMEWFLIQVICVLCLQSEMGEKHFLAAYNHPPVTIHQEDKKDYYQALEPMMTFLRNQTVKIWEKQIRKKFGNVKGMCKIWECT